MFWRETSEAEPFIVPDDVFDLVFRLQGESLDLDHAHALARALGELLDEITLSRIGVLGIRLAESGNGWMRPEEADASLPLSRRSRLAIRVCRGDADRVRALSRHRLRIGEQPITLGEASERMLLSLDTLYARAVISSPVESEDDFLTRVAAELQLLDINVTRMICGRTGQIRTNDGIRHTRAVLVADLRPEESVRLQRQGIGVEQLLGCGIFVPHKGINAVYEPQGKASPG